MFGTEHRRRFPKPRLCNSQFGRVVVKIEQKVSQSHCDLCVLLKTASPLRFGDPHTHLVNRNGDPNSVSAYFQCRACSSLLVRQRVSEGYSWTFASPL